MKTMKKIGVLLLTLAMLAGLCAVGGISLSAESDVEKFSVDFTKYTNETLTKLEEKLAFYYVQDGVWFERPNVNAYVQDENGVEYSATHRHDYGDSDDPTKIILPDSGEVSYSNLDGVNLAGWNHNRAITYWKILDNTAHGIKTLVPDGTGGAVSTDYRITRRMNNFTVKLPNGNLAVLDNFKMRLKYITRNVPAHQDTPTSTSDRDVTPLTIYLHSAYASIPYHTDDGTLVALSPHGGYFIGSPDEIFKTGDKVWLYDRQGNGDAPNNPYYKAYTVPTGTPFLNVDSNDYPGIAVAYPNVLKFNPNEGTLGCEDKYYDLTLTVIEDHLVLEIRNKDGALLETIEKDLHMQGAGYLNIGCGGEGASFCELEVTRLDADGNAVDFSDEDNGEQFSLDIADAVDRIRHTPVGEGFRQTYYRKTPAGSNYPFANLGTDVAFTRATREAQTVAQHFDFNFVDWKIADGAYLVACHGRQNVELVPKIDGTTFAPMSFKTLFDMRLPDEGNFVDLTVRDGVAVRIARNGVTMPNGQLQVYSDNAVISEMRVTARMIEDKLTVKVQEAYTGRVIFEDAVTVTETAPRIAYMASHGNVGIGHFRAGSYCTVTFEGAEDFPPVMVEYGETLGDKLPQSKKEKFDGWADKDGNKVDENTPITEDITLYAQWVKDPIPPEKEASGDTPSAVKPAPTGVAPVPAFAVSSTFVAAAGMWISRKKRK